MKHAIEGTITVEKEKYGIFAWNRENLYPLKKAVAIYVSQKLAQRGADKINLTADPHLGGYVVRPIWKDTSNPTTVGERGVW